MLVKEATGVGILYEWRKDHMVKHIDIGSKIGAKLGGLFLLYGVDSFDWRGCW